MKVKVFSIGLEAGMLENDQKVLNDFLATVTFKKSSTQYVENENYWSLIVHYDDNEIIKPTGLDRKSFEDLNTKDPIIRKLNLRNMYVDHDS